MNIMRTSNNVIIAGNGPSLKYIDYNRLPENYDVFRCNQFYFEESYFLGKKIKAAFFTPMMMFYQYYTAKALKEKGEYEIEYIINSDYGNSLTNHPFNMSDYFLDILSGYNSFIIKNKKLDNEFRYNELYHTLRITSGVYMLLVAAILGYKEIYITGIDFYQEDKYAFNSKKNNLSKIEPLFGTNTPNTNHNHSKEFDLKIIKIIEKEYKLNIYSISSHTEHSVLSELYPLAAKRDNNFQLIKKEENAIKDIVMPNPSIIKKYKNVILKERPRRTNLYQNIFYILIRDLLDIPKHLKTYIKDKYNK